MLPNQPSSPSPDSLSEQRRGARVLIVEPNEAVGNICGRALQHERLQVRLVTTTAAAWEQMAEWRPQFYLVGDDFPDCLGLELVGQLRSKTNAPIMLMTATDSVGYLTNCLEAGADDVMVRPILPPLLLAKCQAQLRRAFRYSVPPSASRSASTVKVSPAPVPPEVEPPASNFNKWPRCEACGYLGPRDRFEGRDEQGRTVIACPACLNNRVRFTMD